MKTYQPTGLGRSIVGLFQEYLPTLRGMSHHTIQSYRDGLVLFLQFAATDCGRAIGSLEVADITADRVGRFLAFLENTSKNSITTRNGRLAARHTFARFLVAGNPDHMAALQQVLGIPFKRGAHTAPIAYLEKAEIEVLLAGIDRSTLSGQRDYAMFSLMFNTGARVQEILNLRVRDVRLESPCQVRLAGKGNKMRVCPIWPRTAQLLKDLIRKQHADVENLADQPVFLNQRGAAMTRFGVRYLLQKYVAAGTAAAPTLAGKRIHPHSLRHPTAIHLLKAGVDFATISQCLGHASLNTTMRYARADIDLKRQALAQVFPELLAPPKGGAFAFHGTDKALDDLARMFNPRIRGWINSYSHFCKSALYDSLRRIDFHLRQWARRKFRRFRHQPKGARVVRPDHQDQPSALRALAASACDAAGYWEPDELRGSRPVL